MREKPLQVEQLKMVIFDWDGTLMDSIAQIVQSLMFAANQLGVPLNANAAKDIIGLALPEAMSVLFPNNKDLHGELVKNYSQHYLAHSQTPLFNGVMDMLIHLKNKELLLGVATGKSRIGLDRVLQNSQTTHLFDATRAASETRSKPNPLMLNQIMQQYGLKPNQCIMVGDTTYDLHMAQNALMPSIGVTYGVHNAQQLMQHLPFNMAGNIKKLCKMLSNMA